MLYACFKVLFNALIVAISSVSSLQPSRRGPSFLYEPPAVVVFSNVTGTVLPCLAEGNPLPVTRWSLADGTPVVEIPGLRHTRPDGSLVFPPFRADDYKRDIHFNVYRCLASSATGKIGSRDVHIRGVVRKDYRVEVFDEFVLAGNTAVFRCRSPDYVKEFLTVTSWLEEPTSTVIQPTNTVGGRYLILPTGELYVRNVQVSHSHRTYKCVTRNRLTGEIVESYTKGTLEVVESEAGISPRIFDFQTRIVIKENDTITLPCASQAYPIPEYHWFKLQSTEMIALVTGERILQLDGTLVIYKANVEDTGTYVCWVNNSLGEEKIHTEVLVTVPLMVTARPSLIRAELGHSALINCTVVGHPLVNVEWRKDMKPIGNERMKRLSGEKLLIEPVQRQDKGMYQCFARNDFETAQSGVEITLGDDRPSFENIFEERTIHPGPPMSLKCIATGSPVPQITWSLDNAPVPESHRISFGDSVTSSGTVVSYVNNSEVRVEDGGLYQCTADNGIGVISHSAKVNVVGPPVIRQMNNITTVAGEMMIIHCPASGYPLETVYWEIRGTRLPFNHRQKIFENGTLEVYDVDRSSDEGPYTCVARNAEGITAQNTIHVKIQVKPIIEPFDFPKSLREGQRSSVMCTVGSGDFPIAIRWFKDNLPISSGSESGIRISEAEDYSSTLLFKTLRLEHRGNYTCVASNEAGTAGHTATMVIHVPPRWIIEPSDISVVKGKSISVDCQAEGFPRPRMRWTKSEGNVPGDFKGIVSSPHLKVFENGSLSVSDAQEEDAGFYLCQASNGIGQGLSNVVRLNVHTSAHFKTKFSAEMVLISYPTSLKCHAIGDKPITIMWLKNNHSLNPGADSRYELIETMVSTGITSEIIIAHSDRGDSALYTCTANNAYGHDVTDIQLIVQEPPDSPTDLKVLEVTSRVVKLQWSPPYNGNSALTQYVIEYKDAAAEWLDKTTNSSVAGSETTASIQSLKPAHSYHLRVIADNRIGKSVPSGSVEVITTEEAPGGPPLNVRATSTSSTSIKVTWRAPAKDLQNGIINGYYVGYTQSKSREMYYFKNGNTAIQFKDEAFLTGLKRNTKYGIIVQAFNSKGAGPASEETEIETFANDPPKTTQIHVSSESSSSIRVSWIPADGENSVTGYLLYYRNNSEEWFEDKIKSDQHSYVLENLECGVRYQFYLIAYNGAGKGEASQVVDTKTEGQVAIAPDKRSAITSNLTSAIVHLSSWKDGGCPITSFTIRFKPRGIRSWTFDKFLSDDNDYEVSNLSSGVEYDLQVKVTNSAGAVETDFGFATLTQNPASNSPKSVVQKNDLSFFVDLTIIIPVVISIVVVIIVLVLVCAVLRRKQASDGNSLTYGFRKSGIPDSVQLTELEKVALNKQTLSLDSFPNPYATTHPYHDTGYHSDEPLYATVKRTPRPPRPDANNYNSPGSAPVTNCGHFKSKHDNNRKKQSSFMRRVSEAKSNRT